MISLITPNAQRVEANTASHVNENIEHQMKARVAYFRAHPNEIPERIAELDAEWDIERAIETEAPVMTLTGLFLGVTVSRKFLAISLLAQSMVLLHATQGWYPLLPLFRRLGFRTALEIETERVALLEIQHGNHPR